MSGGDSKRGSHSDVGVKRILKDGSGGGARAFSMNGLPMSSLDLPGRKSPEDAGREEVRRLRAELRSRLEEMEALQARLGKEREEIRQKALAEGREAGRKDSQESARAEYQKSLTQLQTGVKTALDTFAGAKRDYLLAVEEDAIRLVGASLRKVFGRVPEDYPELLPAVLRRAMESLGRYRSAVVRVHPEDFPVAEAERAFWRDQDDGAEVRVEEDARIGRGSCVVETADCTVEMDLAKITAKLEAELETVLAGRQERRRLEAAGGAVQGD